MNSDIVFVFLLFLLIFLFFLAVKYFKYLFFYIGIILGIFLGAYGEIFLKNNDYKLSFLDVFLNNFRDFFTDSKIVNFLLNNLNYLFFLIIIILFHKIFYSIGKVLIVFFIWFYKSLKNWLINRKELKKRK